jgi:hypothetical protein
MSSIIEEANAYEPTEKMGNIADLKKVSINLDLKKETRINKDGESYDVMFIVVEDKEYRIPGVVLGSIKQINEKEPNMTHFYVIKSGSGKEGTKYQVIPLRE